MLTNKFKKNNKILIDASSLFDQYSSRGIGRYTRELLKTLIKEIVEDEEWDLAMVGFHDLAKNMIDIGYTQFSIEELSPEIEFFSLGEPYPSTYKNISKWQRFDEAIYELEPDVYFAMHFERGLPSTPKLKHSYKNVKTIVTVHDLIPIVTNKFSQKNFIVNILKKRFYEFMFKGVVNADLIFTSSEFSKKDLKKYGNIEEDNVEVIYLGVDDSFYRANQNYSKADIEEVLNRFEVQKSKYLFYDSGVESNKGVDELLESLKLFFEYKDSSLPKEIVIVGNSFYKGKGENIKSKNTEAEQFINKARKLGILENIVTTGLIDEDELKILLNNSQLYVYLSLYEGFGFGPIQAMAAEIPAVVSNQSCLPEITEEIPVMVDPRDPKKVASAIRKLAKDQELQKEMIKKGLKLAKKYNWELTSEATWDRIKKLELDFK